jgi:hypothetical protein
MRNIRLRMAIYVSFLAVLGVMLLLGIGYILNKNKPIYTHSSQGIEATIINTDDNMYDCE